MSPTVEIVSAKSVRSRFAFLFDSVAELYRFHYGQKPSTKFDEIKAATIQLKEDDYLTDYLFCNLENLYSMYPSLRPGMYESQDKLFKLNQLLAIVIGDICAEIKDISDQSEEHDIEMLWKSLLG